MADDKLKEQTEGAQDAPEKNEAPAEKVSTPVGDLLGDVIKKQKAGELENKKAEPENDEDEDEEPVRKKEKKHVNVKQLKHGMMSTVWTIVFVGIVVLVNIIATVLFERYPLTFDLTKDKKYSVSEDSINYIKTIDMDVMVTIFATEDQFAGLTDYTQQAVEVLKMYKRYNDRIDYRFVDIESNPDILSQYEANTINQFDIIFETNPSKDVKRVRKLTLIDLMKFRDDFNQQMSQNYGVDVDTLADNYGDLRVIQSYINFIESSRADEAFVSALMAVADPNPVNAVFVKGRVESDPLKYLHTLLEANGYFVKDIDITKEEIPEDTRLVIVPAPSEDYLPEEVKKLSDYLYNGGEYGKQMLYCASIRQGSTPNLDEFLEEYGIKIGEGVVCESSGDDYYTMPYYAKTSNINNQFTDYLTVKDPVILNVFSRPITRLFDERTGAMTYDYVTSTDNAFVADVSMKNILQKGKQTYVALSTKVKYSTDGKGTFSNLLVFGSVETISDNYLKFPQFDNREYLLSLLAGMTGKAKTGLVIAPKVVTGNLFDLTAKQSSVLQWTFIVIVPAVVLIIGGVIWKRRKNR